MVHRVMQTKRKRNARLRKAKWEDRNFSKKNKKESKYTFGRFSFVRALTPPCTPPPPPPNPYAPYLCEISATLREDLEISSSNDSE